VAGESANIVSCLCRIDFNLEVNMNPQNNEKRRIVQSPAENLGENSSPVINVELADDEDVEWIWTHYPNGQSVVSGYKIIEQDGSTTHFTIEKES
jgi:hypothetical protein